MTTFYNWLSATCIAILLVFAPIKSTMVAVGALIVLDWVTGIWAAYKRGNPITSFKMRRTLAKMLAYEFTVIFGFIIERYMIDGVPVVKVVAASIGLIEAKSFFENIHVITGMNVLQSVLDKVQGKPLDISEALKPNDEKK